VALQQSVPRYAPPERGQVEDRAGLETAAAQRQALYQDFGSAKKRRVLKSQEANRVDMYTVVGSTSSGPEEWSTTALSASNLASYLCIYSVTLTCIHEVRASPSRRTLTLFRAFIFSKLLSVVLRAIP
jgi:A49-like RNA polymerase I associated factor